MRKLPVLLLALPLALAGCVTPTTKQFKAGDVQAEIEAKKQRELALRTLVNDQTRLYRTAYPIRTMSADLCRDTSYTSGVIFANNVTFGPMFKEAMGTAFALSDVVKTFYVQPGSPAEQAGIRAGDIPVSINGWAVPLGDKADEALNGKLAEWGKTSTPLTIEIIRDNARQTLAITPVKTCAYQAQLSQDDVVNAFADGKVVVITKGMMRFAKDDSELALVIGHELAHNAMKHMNAKQTNQLLGSIFDIVAAAYGINTQGGFGNAAGMAYSQEFEAEADYVGLYMIAKAGVNISDAPNFWRRMATDHPSGINENHASSHPSTPQRFLALESTVAEIQGKIANNQPLTPDLKK